MRPTRLISAILSVACAAVSGCSGVQISDVSIQQVPQYELNQNQKGLGVALDPFYEEDRLERYFGKNLLFHGILPILIVVRNHTDQPVLVQTDRISLLGVDDISIPQVAIDSARAPIARESIPKEKALFLAGVVFTPAMLLSDKELMDRDAILQNIRRKALVDRSLYPGELHHGFVYFYIKRRDALGNRARLELEIKNLSTDGMSRFDFTLTNKR